MSKVNESGAPVELIVKMARTQEEEKELRQELEEEREALVLFFKQESQSVSDDPFESLESLDDRTDLLPVVPALLKTIPNWVEWRKDDARGKVLKIAGTKLTRNAKSDDPATWVSYEALINGKPVIDSTQGVGFVLNGDQSKNLVTWDIDGCRNSQTGEITDWAWEILTALGNPYTEITPSGNGIRPWVIGVNALPAGKKNKEKFLLANTAGFGDKVQIEIFADGQFVTVTGNHLAGASTEIPNRGDLSGVLRLCESIAAKHSLNPSDVCNKKPVSADPNGDKIQYGNHDTTLHAIAGSLRHQGLEEEAIYNALVEVCEKRCERYGSDYLDMCKKHAHNICAKPPGNPLENVVLVGDHVAGTTPQTVEPRVSSASGLITAPEEIKKFQEKMAADKAASLSQWRSRFKTVSELEEGEPIMLIKGFLPEGVTFFGSLPSEGKTWLALSVSKALTTGRHFLSRSDFSVPVITPVLYLSPESGGRTFKRRCKKMGIPNDEKLFLCQTISEGKMLLADPHLLEAVRQMKPVVILDTLIRFNEADSENEAMQNKQLVDDVTELRRTGAIAVIPLHHATKAIRSQGLSLETVLRGTGDLAASADCVWGLLRDESLYQNGAGPNEVEIICAKPRDMDPPPLPFRIAFSRRIPRTVPLHPGMSESSGVKIGLAPGIESIIDATGDLQVCQNTANQERKEAEEKKNSQIIVMITANPTITLEVLEAEVGIPASTIGKILKKLGWHKPKGGAKGGNSWVKKPIIADIDPT